MKRLAALKVEKEESKNKLKKVMTPDQIRAQAQKLAEYEAKRKRMLEEFNHYITNRADKLPIMKISYKIQKNWDSVSGYTLAYKDKGKANDILLKNLKAKFEWIKIRARKLGIPPPPELSSFGLFPAEKKRKRSSKILKEVFVSKDIVVDEMHRNLVPPPGVEGSRGLVISEPESGIFFYNRKFDLVFQREEEFHLATTAQLIRIQSAIQRDTLEEMFKKMELAIEARSDVAEARKIVKENLDGLGQYMADIAYLLLYVDDIILTTSIESFLQQITSSLHAKFSMTDLSSLNYFLGILAQRTSACVLLSQSKTPVDIESKLGPDVDPISDFTLSISICMIPFHVSTTTQLTAYTDVDWAEAKYKGVANVVAKTA
ncbi:retrovirus-related pol polyprotein from transposon TNT 1-94 [Tanacetum coccineum]